MCLTAELRHFLMKPWWKPRFTTDGSTPLQQTNIHNGSNMASRFLYVIPWNIWHTCLRCAKCIADKISAHVWVSCEHCESAWDHQVIHLQLHGVTSGRVYQTMGETQPSAKWLQMESQNHTHTRTHTHTWTHIDQSDDEWVSYYLLLR